MNPNYIIDEDNKKIAVQLSINVYHKITQTLENYALYNLMQENADDEFLSLQDAKNYYKSLKEI